MHMGSKISTQGLTLKAGNMDFYDSHIQIKWAWPGTLQPQNIQRHHEEET